MRTDRAIDLFLTECRYLSLAPKTLSAYQWALRKLQAAHRTIPTRAEALVKLIADQDLGQESKHDLWRVLRRLYRWLSARHRVANAMADVPPPRRRKRLPRTLEASEIARLLQVTRERRDRAMLALLLDTGIRIGELANLRWTDVQPGAVRVDGKTGQRVVPVSPNVLQLLLGLGDGDHIWVGRKGPLTWSGVNQAVRRALYRAGISGSKSGPHMLRHTFGTAYIRDGGNIRVLQEIMGHQDLKTTMIYVHLAGRDLSADHARHSPLRALDLDTPQSHQEDIV